MKRCDLLILLLLCAACSRDPIEGRWQRVGDEFAGTVIEVRAQGRHFQGRLTQVSEKLRLSGFAGGDWKWRDLTFVGESSGVRRYAGQDLGKQTVLETQQTDGARKSQVESRYASLKLEVRADTAWVRVFAEEQDVLGRAQLWRKLK